ncbi:hypothetical protein [Bacillus sp. UMB0893]|uniref:hypothetical protein n=1 Tax=Bacillus sp. UMB0893 TaxID=2066053 RepID=UPI000C78C064|nr:hypothetical protein [Bacillus sp. UMB0893]PLR67942.1 hypothetical protein CYJ36_11535 [Bacillus sp. UMB0893]
MKKYIFALFVTSVFLISGCSIEDEKNEKAQSTQLIEMEAQVKQLKLENSKLKAENAKLQKEIRLDQKQNTNK